MKNIEYNIGYKSCYINDHNFKHITDIPAISAMEWVQNIVPDVNMGNGIKAIELTNDGDNDTDINSNGWLNKLFVIVGHEHGKFVAINNQDGKFSIRIQL